MDFQSVCKKLKESWIFSAVVIVVLGLLLVLFPAAALTSVSYVLGGLAIAMGVIRTVRYFKQDHTYPYLFQSDLVVGTTGKAPDGSETSPKICCIKVE